MPEIALKALYTREEVRRMLGITERQLRQWERHALIQGDGQFTLSDIVAMRTLIQLQREKIPPRTIRSAMTAIRSRLRHIANPLKELKIFSDGRRIRVQVGNHSMEPHSGQLLFNFDGAEIKRLLAFPRLERKTQRVSAERLFLEGLDMEQQGCIPDAIRAYESAVRMDPGSAGAWLNLGTIFFNARQFSRAEGHYKKALEADPQYALAHFNIANLYDERGDFDRAMRHYLESIRLNPGYPDAHYNLALLFQGNGQVMEAVRHWKTYLKLDPGSDWGIIARQELDKLRKSTVLEGRAGVEQIQS